MKNAMLMMIAVSLFTLSFYVDRTTTSVNDINTTVKNVEASATAKFDEVKNKCESVEKDLKKAQKDIKDKLKVCEKLAKKFL